MENAIGRLTEEVFSLRQEIKKNKIREQAAESSAQYMLEQPCVWSTNLVKFLFFYIFN